MTPPESRPAHVYVGAEADGPSTDTSKISLSGWRRVTIGEIAVVGSGSTPDRTKDEFWNGDIPWITTGEINYGVVEDSEEKVTHKAIEYGLRLFPAGSILMAMYGQGATRGRIAELGIQAAINQNSCAIICNSEVVSKYIYYFLENNYNFIRGLSNGGGQHNLNNGIVRELEILLPPLPEQRKIAAILSTWDDSLSTLTRLIAAKRQQKRALAEQLLTGQRRLNGFEGEWETLRFGDVFIRITRRNIEGNEHALTISGTHGLIDQREFFNKRVAASDLSGYYLIRRGEFAYNKSYSAGYDFGAIKRLNLYSSGVVSTLYICFALNRADADSNFYEQFFEANLLNEGISGIAQEGARNHGLLNVSVKDFFELDLPFPPPPEQRAIAAVLSTLDDEISALDRLQASVQEQKRGLMDALLTGRVRVNVEDA
ncbi:restriction endonuclease subunit S [Deinococcus petrolearius]|uniref:Restriction endonuclease subunit S n=2 Tax=Deinococcus petrolearius TaxID=1751295 RepID=A0ABW1DQ84_9DEIO